jgi:hypothetical protein
MFFEQAGVDMENLMPLDRVMPVNPRHTAQEWQEIYAAQVPSPVDNSNYKKGTEAVAYPEIFSGGFNKFS